MDVHRRYGVRHPATATQGPRDGPRIRGTQEGTAPRHDTRTRDTVEHTIMSTTNMTSAMQVRAKKAGSADLGATASRMSLPNITYTMAAATTSVYHRLSNQALDSATSLRLRVGLGGARSSRMPPPCDGVSPELLRCSADTLA